VAAENPELYYEIQRLNAYGAEPLESLRLAVERIQRSVQDDDVGAFVEMMQRGREYLRVRQAAREEAG
jgi:chorismate mutase/prephenate dehydrogenase